MRTAALTSGDAIKSRSINLPIHVVRETSVARHRRRTARGRAAGAVAVLIAPVALYGAIPAHAASVSTDYRLAAISFPSPATVLTLEGGLVGVQTLIHLTPRQLHGAFCAAPNTCIPVDYLALPGQTFNEAGADGVIKEVNALPANGQAIILMGHSEGAQVIYSVLRRWQANPATAPAPSHVSWISMGNPDNRFGGFQTKAKLVQDPLPDNTPYTGVEVIRQYDGWADWPDDPTNTLAVLNAIAGEFLVHPDYTNVNINDPANVRYTPTLPDGTPGKVTYVWVPNPVLPLISGTGPLAPLLDAILRPIIEFAYHRPVKLPAPGASAPAPVTAPGAASVASPPVESASRPTASLVSNVAASPSVRPRPAAGLSTAAPSAESASGQSRPGKPAPISDVQPKRKAASTAGSPDS